MRVLLECVLLVALLVLGFLADSRSEGATLIYPGFAVLFSGTFLWRLLVLRGRARPLRGVFSLLEVVSFTGVVTRPIGLWSHGLLVAVALSLVAAPGIGLAEPEGRATILEELLVGLIALGSAAFALVANKAEGSKWAFVTFLPLALEAWGPRAPRTVASAVRRAAAFSVAGSAAVMLGSDWRTGARADEIVFGVALVLAFLAALEVVNRTVSRETSGRVEELLRGVVAAGDGRARWLGFAAAAALAGAALLGLGVFKLKMSRTIEPSSITKEVGLAFLAPVAIAAPDGMRRESTLEVLEDGHPLGLGHTFLDEASRLGHGRFFHGPRGVVFSSTDGSDPRSNGRRYELRYDWTPGGLPLFSLVVLCVLLNARRGARAARRLEEAHPAVIGLLLAALALALRLLVASREPALTFGGHLVKGVPFSDARDWYEAALAFSRGDRAASVWGTLGARRPFYYALLGAIFALAGPSVAVARALNIATSVLAPVLAFDGLRRIAPRPVALLAALAQALLLYDARSDLSVMTEPLGNFLGALSFWAFSLGAEAASGPKPRTRRALLALLGSGAALGLSNLARPLTVAAIAGMPLALAFVAGRVSLPWRRLVAGAAAFGAGAAITLGPWMLRQHVVHGVWTISENTAEGWYGATDPAYGSWTSEVGLLAGARSTRERVAFYMEGTSRNLRQHTGWYVRHVIDQVGICFKITQPEAWVIVAAFAWYLVRVLGTPGRPRGAREAVSLPAALLGMMLTLTPSPPLYGFTLLALVVAIASRRPIVLVAGLLVPTLVSVGMMGMAYERRLTHAVEWAAAALAAWVVLEGLVLVETGSLRGAGLPDEAGSWGRAGRVAGVLGALAVALALAGFLRVLVSRPVEPDVSVLPGEPWVSRALDGETRAALGPLADRLVVRRVRVRPGFEIRIAASERVDNWAPLFEPRPYAFTIFATDPATPEGYVVSPGWLSGEEEARELVLVGVPVVAPGSTVTLELFAIGVARDGGEPVTWLHPARDVARAHAERIAAVSSASSATASSPR